MLYWWKRRFRKDGPTYGRKARRAPGNPSPGRAGTQFEKRGRKRAPAQDCGDCGGVRLGKVLPGPGGALRRGLPAVFGGPFHLHPAADDPGGQGGRGPGALRARGAGPPPAAGGAGHPQHLWHRDGAVKLPAADVLPAGQPPLPQRARRPPYPGGGGGTGHHLPGVRRHLLRAGGGGAGL